MNKFALLLTLTLVFKVIPTEMNDCFLFKPIDLESNPKLNLSTLHNNFINEPSPTRASTKTGNSLQIGVGPLNLYQVFKEKNGSILFFD